MTSVELLTYTPDPERIVAVAARSCLEDEDASVIGSELKSWDIERLIATTFAKGHHSVFEHANFTFSLSGVSRVLTHQLVRHRIASYSQLSQQRSDSTDIDFVVPPEIRRVPQLAEAYRRHMEESRALYRSLLSAGVSMGSARYALPSSAESRVVFTMNARSLFNLIAQRECGAEEWEFRQVATMVHRELVTVAPAIFRLAGPKCVTDDYCPEGEVGLRCSRGIHLNVVVSNTKNEILAMLQPR